MQMQSESMSRLKTGSRARAQEIHSPVWMREMLREMRQTPDYTRPFVRLVDPCASSVESERFADLNITEADGMTPAQAVDSHVYEDLVYVNPPFGALAEWATACAMAASKGVSVIMLCPARLHRRKLVESLLTADRIYALDYNVKFIGYDHTYPEPLLFVCWGCRIPSAYLTRVTSIITLK